MATRKQVFRTEREMHSCWLDSAGLCLETTDGRLARVVYPGIREGNYGPDYRHAVIAFGVGPFSFGDVELHLRGTDWDRHGHQHDHAYDNVILHVVGDAGKVVETRLAGGGDAPTAVFTGLSLDRCRMPLPCAGSGRRLAGPLLDAVERAGVARLLSRACAIVCDAADSDPWKALVLRTARALGYRTNAVVAQNLGELLLAPALDAALMQADSSRKAALMIGVAGLLPEQRRRAGVAVLDDATEYESIWKEAHGSFPSLEPRLWRIHGVYLNNHPVRRVVALAELWPRLKAMAGNVSQLLPKGLGEPRCAARQLERLFLLPGEGYWRQHADFGLRSHEADLIGGSKAREIVVNALLPCIAAAAISCGDMSLLSRLVRLYLSYPPAATNAVLKHMEHQLGLGGRRISAAAQQGLLHLFSEYCRRGGCALCPLARICRFHFPYTDKLNESMPQSSFSTAQALEPLIVPR